VNPNQRRTVDREETEMLFSHFLPAVRWKPQSRTLEVKAPCSPNLQPGSLLHGPMSRTIRPLPRSPSSECSRTRHPRVHFPKDRIAHNLSPFATRLVASPDWIPECAFGVGGAFKPFENRFSASSPVNGSVWIGFTECLWDRGVTL